MKQFQLNTNITVDFLTQVETALVSIFHERFLVYQDRFHYRRIQRTLLVIVKFLSLLGLVALLLTLAIDHASFKSDGEAIWLIGVFLLLLALTWAPKKLEEKRRRFFRPYWTWLSKRYAKGLLKKAKKIAPFVAEYDFRGDLATYYRTKNEKSQCVWTRKIHGYRLSGSGFTLFYKKEKSLHPYAIVLHDSAKEFELYLDALEIRPLGRSLPACTHTAGVHANEVCTGLKES